MMKNKAFIFDMDGVIVNSEPVWSRYEEKFMPELMGQDAYGKIKDQILGNSISRIYEAASVYGFN
ncbi:HAD family phosphatase, partial [Candidatus Gottesmanbacteria bacterium]|nr:HAD family phosphatase [Candidatus Gottesmanbacteria bacterium]